MQMQGQGSVTPPPRMLTMIAHCTLMEGSPRGRPETALPGGINAVTSHHTLTSHAGHGRGGGSRSTSVRYTTTAPVVRDCSYGARTYRMCCSNCEVWQASME